MAEMHSWTRAASPSIKFEGSPTESLLSTPDEMYPSLFGTSASPTTVNPLEMMSPESLNDDDEDDQPDLTMLAGLTSLTQTSSSVAGTPEPERKQTKKRKSWGQVLPEPKTNLPPRYVTLRHHPPRHRLLTRQPGNVPRPKTRRNSAGSSASSATAAPPSRRASGSVWRLRASSSGTRSSRRRCSRHSK